MGALKDRLSRWLGGNELVGDADELVEAALVALMGSEIIVSKLDVADIPATAIQEHGAFYLPSDSMRPMARIFVRRGDLERAMPIINEVSIGW